MPRHLLCPGLYGSSSARPSTASPSATTTSPTSTQAQAQPRPNAHSFQSPTKRPMESPMASPMASHMASLTSSPTESPVVTHLYLQLYLPHSFQQCLHHYTHNTDLTRLEYRLHWRRKQPDLQQVPPRPGLV